MSFGRAFFSSCLGALTALILFTVLCVIMVFGLIGTIANADKQVVVDAKSVLHLKLDAEITEVQRENPFAGLPVPGGDDRNVGLMQLKSAIEHAKKDDKIEGILIDVTYPMTGIATIEEIRQALIEFREGGKWVYAYGEVLTEQAYYLASAADRIYLHPEGEVEFNGLVAEVTFFKKMLEKLEVTPQVFRVGEFKSAVEPFLNEQMSEPSRLQISELLASVYTHMLTRISETRNQPVDKLRNVADNMLIVNAKAAIDNGLIDSLIYKDQFLELLKRKLDVKETKDLNFISYNRYRKSFNDNTGSGKNEVAVIVADGTIMPGESDGSDNVVFGETFADEIRKAREDKDVKAIVIRVNSPGGEFRASDMMWREVDLATKVKPVIASMGDVAASGGYYLAMAADTIVAMPHTITGSIGIFSILFDASDLLENKLGITFDEVRTGKYGDTYTISRPLTDEEKRFLQRNVEEIYATFVGKAADGRGMEDSEIMKVASGRVWSGQQALDRGLVDVLGDFDTAIKIAVDKAGIADDYKIRFYPRQKPFFQELMTQLEENSEARSLKSTLGEMYPYYLQARKLKTYQGVQARFPFELNIH